jgi:hypothetical protein
MRQLVFAGKGKLEWREAAEPRLESSSDALVPVATIRLWLWQVAVRRGLRIISDLEERDAIGYP